MSKFFSRFLKDKSGVTAIEYGLIAAFLAVCLVAATPKITSGLSGQFATIGTNISSGGAS